MDDPNALDPSVSLTGKKMGKGPFIIAGVVVAAVVGVIAFKMMKEQDERKLHAAFMEEFATVEKQEVGKFWVCVLGPGVDPGTLPNNLALSQRVEGAFSVDLKNYPIKIREECTPKANDAKKKVAALATPPMYEDAIKKYASSLTTLAAAFDSWAEAAPAQVQEREVGKKVGEFGAAWHAFSGGKPGNDVAAFDRFLHCAVPGVDGMKDGQAVVEYLFKQCKDLNYAARVSNECGKEVTSSVPAGPSKGFQTALRKLAADDRELSAFDDCLRKARKSKRKDDLEGVGQAFVAYMDAGREVRKIGAEALKEK
jgi:hypothetical protein